MSDTWHRGTPEEDWANREEIFKAWMKEHVSNCGDCILDIEDGSMESACAEYHLIRLLYTRLVAKENNEKA